MAAFDAVRGTLAPALAPDALAALGDAIATLGFAAAAAQVQEIMTSKGL